MTKGEIMQLDAGFYQGNRARLAAALPVDSLVLITAGKPVHMSGDADYPFFANNNFYYLTGIREPEVVLVLNKAADGEVSEGLFIKEADPKLEKWVGKTITAEAAQLSSGITEVAYLQALEGYLQGFKPRRFYYDASLAGYQRPEIEERCLKVFSQTSEPTDIAPLIAKLRLYKQPAEVAAIRRAIELTAQGLGAIREALRPGVSEYELAALFEYTIKSRGADGVAFDTIAAGGGDATILHYIENKKTLGEGEAILFDLGARYQGYCGDISRTYPVGSTFTMDQAKVYAAVIYAQEKLIDLYRPGTTMKALQEATKELLLQGCQRVGLKVPGKDISHYYYHGVGHSLGLDTHDTADKRDYTLAPGMVLTCEPGLYVAELGVGVRIEDDILVTEDAPENLSAAIPKLLAEVS